MWRVDIMINQRSSLSYQTIKFYFMSRNKTMPDIAGDLVDKGSKSDMKSDKRSIDEASKVSSTVNNKKNSDNLKTEDPAKGLRRGNPTNAHSHKY